jgi:SAM-dependent methyltransferase
VNRGAAAERAHTRIQEAHWGTAQPAHYRWKTQTEGFATSERELLRWVGARGRVLEVGCGEGANVFHLGPAGEGAFVLDRFPAKVAFARGAQPGLRGVVADVQRLPFAAESFDTVLVRDLLHHVHDRGLALAELWRVLRPGGRLSVLEVNALNPLFLAQALLVEAERGILRSTPRRLVAELERLPGRLGPVERSMAQALPVSRVVLHPDMGRPALGRRRSVRRVLGGLEALSALFLPRSTWAYIRVAAVKDDPRG